MKSTFRPAKTFRCTHDNGDHFLVSHDYAAGKKNRYTVLVWRVGRTAKIIGRELSLGHAKLVVEHWPKRVPENVRLR